MDGPPDHLVALIDAIQKSACANDTMFIVTYDEFGGSWDHVPSPGQGTHSGPHDRWGSGTRIPALIVAPHLRGPFVVDHTSYDTTSILATLETRYGVTPLGTRDGAVQDLSNVFEREGSDNCGPSVAPITGRRLRLSQAREQRHDELP